jgi:hypothetical protein
MGHLTSVELVDLAEGSREDRTMPHLASCDGCRRQLADLRAMISAGHLHAGGDVPEPSPLFWDHLSARVQDGVANERVPTRTSVLGFWPRAAIAAAVALVVAVVAGLGSRVAAPGTQTAVALPPPRPIETIQNGQTAPAWLDSLDDPTLGLVADYGGTLDWDDVREQMAVPASTGSMEASVGELDAGERQELHRLLKEELARPAGRAGRS